MLMKTKNLLIYSLFIGTISACSVQGNDQKQQSHQAADLGLAELTYENATAYDTVLTTEPMVDRRFVRMPDTPQGYRVQALLEVIMARDEEQILPFVYEHYDPDFIDQVPQNKHKELLQQLQQLEAAGVEKLEKLDNAYRIGVETTEGSLGYTLDVYFEPEAPYKISGVRIL